MPRKDENGNECPATLGEYYDLIHAIMPNSRAAEFLEEKIAAQGRDEEVIAPDSQMRLLLMPMMLQPREKVKE